MTRIPNEDPTLNAESLLNEPEILDQRHTGNSWGCSVNSALRYHQRVSLAAVLAGTTINQTDPPKPKVARIVDDRPVKPLRERRKQLQRLKRKP